MAAGGGATVAILAASKARRVRDVLDAFRIADATAPSRAVPLDQLTLGERHLPEIVVLARDGILVQGTGDGGWWLDERAFIARRDRPGSRTVRVVLIVGALLLAILAIMMLTLVPTTTR